ncbi:CHASE2 domain-containing protein [Thermodesulfobacteriota bacterium]
MIINKERGHSFLIFLVFCSFIGAHFFYWALPNLFGTWNVQTIDRLFLFRSSSQYFRPNYDDTVVHVDISDSSIQSLDKFYLDRSHHAKAIQNLAAMEASSLLYDFIFGARINEEQDRLLIDATLKAGNVYYGMALKLLREDEPKLTRPTTRETEDYLAKTVWKTPSTRDSDSLYEGVNPLITFVELSSVARGVGFLSLKTDSDGVFRRLPLIVAYKGALFPSLTLRAVSDYLRVPPEKIIVKPGEALVLKDARLPHETKKHDIRIPIDQQGNMVINFIGGWERMKHYNFADVLQASEDRDELEMWRDELSGKMIIVSEVLTGSTDVGSVPTDNHFPLSGIHANAIHTILTESFIKELSNTRMLFVELLLVAITLLLSLRFSALPFSLSTLCLAVLYIVMVIACFLYGQIILNVIRPVMMLAFVIIVVVIYRYVQEEREKLESLKQQEFIRATFGRYLSNEVVEELLRSPKGLELNGELKEVTFLVSDLRGFTALSNQLSPHEVIHILNRYLERMVDVIGRYRGTVNEIEGDGILSFFGAPISSSNDPERAVACAIEMQNLLMEMNEKERQQGLPELNMGIGINTGEVVVGNIGSQKRAKYAAIGSPINVAYRIESCTVGGQILISEGTYERIKPAVRLRETMEVQFKGITKPSTLYDIVGIEGDYQLYLTEKKDEKLIELETPLSIKCYPLSGKQVSDRVNRGHIISLGTSSAEVLLSDRIDLHSNLKILVSNQAKGGLSELYAKIVSLGHSDSITSNIRAGLEFTWLSDDIRHFFAGLLAVRPL